MNDLYWSKKKLKQLKKDLETVCKLASENPKILDELQRLEYFKRGMLELLKEVDEETNRSRKQARDYKKRTGEAI